MYGGEMKKAINQYLQFHNTSVLYFYIHTNQSKHVSRVSYHYRRPLTLDFNCLSVKRRFEVECECDMRRTEGNERKGWML